MYRLMAIAAAIALAVCGCGKDEGTPKGSQPTAKSAAKAPEKKAAPEEKKAPEKPAPEEKAAPEKKPSPAKVEYPPKGNGPHEGFDLAAIRDKLQGAWLIGGSAFSSIPHIWFVQGDSMVIVDGRQNQTKNSYRLLSPCELKTIGEGNLGTWHSFVIDGDTLYAGLGSSGVKQGSKTVACFAAGTYVRDGDSCVKWTREPFGEGWQSEPGDCAYEADGAVFYGDDTNSKRKIYGKEKLKVHGDVLMTDQMKGNEAKKVASLEAALAEQQAKIDAVEALKHPPKDLVFKDWDLGGGTVEVESGKYIWAAGVSRKKTWGFGRLIYRGLNDGIPKTYYGTDLWAPPAFIKPAVPQTGLAKGAPVLVQGTSWGRFAEQKGDKLVIEQWAGQRVDTREVPLDAVLPVRPGQWEMGAPVLYTRKHGDKDILDQAVVVLAKGDEVYLATDEKPGLLKLPKAELSLVDPTPLAVGTKVRARRYSGFSPLLFEPAEVIEVHNGGLGYKVKAESGEFSASWDLVAKQ